MLAKVENKTIDLLEDPYSLIKMIFAALYTNKMHKELIDQEIRNFKDQEKIQWLAYAKKVDSKSVYQAFIESPAMKNFNVDFLVKLLIYTARNEQFNFNWSENATKQSIDAIEITHRIDYKVFEKVYQDSWLNRVNRLKSKREAMQKLKLLF